MKEMYGGEIPLWMRILGVWRVNRDSVDFQWGYFAPKFGLEFMVHRGFYFETRYAVSICLGWGQLHIKLPFRANIEASHDWQQYGFQIADKSLWIRRGECEANQQSRRPIIWDFPFASLIYESHEVQRKDGSWVPYVGSWERGKEPDQRYTETHSFTYTLRSGEVQRRKATIYKDRRRYHRKWLPFLKKTFTCIDVAFNDEVGERSGSWKGGTVGCSYDLLPGESMLDCLRRMEREREFN